MVLPSDDPDVFLVKPLGGTDEEVLGIFKPLANADDIPSTHDFRKPEIKDIGDIASARLLYNAARLSFRNAAGPFRCLGKISFRPRSYQMVPLIMALRQDVTRLLIADDVGVGKTIEALLIARELHERREINRFAIVCLPHLCDQWQDELKSKFGIEAVIIRSGTVAALNRQVHAHEKFFSAFPFQIISIDFIKMGDKREVFLADLPDLIIVDEAHSCARPSGAAKSQQLRYSLLHDIAKQRDKHLVLLTATPHSGKQEEFQSLLGLLRPEFEETDVTEADEKQRRALAKHFVQRRRQDVVQWVRDTVVFPERDSYDAPYIVKGEYSALFNDVLEYCRELVQRSGGDKRRQRFSYWEALALLRGVMSSPDAGVAMLEKKAQKKAIGQHPADAEAEEDVFHEEVLDAGMNPDDNLALSLMDAPPATGDSEVRKLRALSERMKKLSAVSADGKAAEAIGIARDWLDRGMNPIFFCRYIQTANYLGRMMAEGLKDKKFKDVHVEIITSESDDELRRAKIKSMNASARRVLIATDCLSEGINLQEGFNALAHYDLPWNPNRLEQREGRIDRYGQPSPEVEIKMIYGSNNPVDGTVLDVLLKKAVEIRKQTGISVPFPEDSSSVMEAVTQAILLKPTVSAQQTATQLTMFHDDLIRQEKDRVHKALEEAKEKMKRSRSIFAQNAIKAEEIEEQLNQVDEAIGDERTPELMMRDAMRFLGVQMDEKGKGYRVVTTNLPERLRHLLTPKQEILISFQSPTPAGYTYIGRNHPFMEHLCQSILNDALNNPGKGAPRVAVVRTPDVTKTTVVFQFRVRNVIADESTRRQIVAEEMWLWGYEGNPETGNRLEPVRLRELLLTARPSQRVTPHEEQYWFNEAGGWIHDKDQLKRITDPVAIDRANELVRAHEQFGKVVKSARFTVVEPVLPMDVLGFYVLLPGNN